ncbi:hypothetical protein SAMN03159338_4448 [Sphingomonas sp. NFR04]|uniref:hypothetical protein n=1 Tax=Sphingomonas sp. NFR04 TaxID=1566283 RepID=UPI0008EC7B71|nr:hypothetical protein [Sphingomonas sp. NFR04]SFK52413.1 hypothetical protein SAMN03159338_4448 [Sphingomonas sp. NFR04]
MTVPQRHPFLDDLAEDVVLHSSILPAPVSGRAEVLRVVKAGGSLYRRQIPTFLGNIEGRGIFEYDIELTDGSAARGLVSMVRNGSGEVTQLHITFSPQGAVLAMAQALAAPPVLP